MQSTLSHEEVSLLQLQRRHRHIRSHRTPPVDDAYRPREVLVRRLGIERLLDRRGRRHGRGTEDSRRMACPLVGAAVWPEHEGWNGTALQGEGQGPHR